MKSPMAWGRLVFILAGLIPAAALLWFGPTFDNNESGVALRILATVLSILAGFLMAVITMLGDPRAVYYGSWRVASAHRRQIRNALRRFTMLFYVYLVAIAAAFAAALFEEYTACAMYTPWVRHVALSLGVAALVWSFGLPVVIYRTQLNRLDEEVNTRRPAPDTDG